MGNKKAEECSTLLVFSLCIFFSLLSARGAVVNTLRDSDGDSVVSEGGGFQLGFFTPHDDASRRRYVGIWYHGSQPEVVVWVANRNKPLYNNNGTFAITKDGNLKVLASDGTSLWSTTLQFSSHNNTTMVLMDSGNLILKESGVNGTTLWQSFQNPTDTFLSGMIMTEDLKLTSWKSSDDPSPGNFTFLKDAGGRYIIERLSAPYWVNKELWQNFSTETDGVIGEVIDLLSTIGDGDLKANNYTVRFQNQELDYNYTRAVMDFSGKIEYLARNRVGGKWDAIWSEPENICSVVSACGAFASCRSDSKHTCRCLPGFEPKSKDEWDSGDYSNGCQRKTEICIKEVAQAGDFLTINMKVRKTSNIVKADNNKSCRTKCLESCTCQAFSEVTTINRTDSTVACVIWDDELQNIWEYAAGGGFVNIRIKRSDIELTQLDCKTCGTNIVPYPLSLRTEFNCGDPAYRNFTCKISTGQVLFQPAAGVYYNVT